MPKSKKEGESSKKPRTKVSEADIKVSEKRPRSSLYRAPEAKTASKSEARTEKTSHCPDNWGSE